MKSVMKHSFSQVPKAEIQRSSFNRSHGYKSTINAGYLYPFFVDFAVPGDTFNLKASVFARLATLIKPPMDNMFMDTFFFSVPYRLVWDNWTKFMGEQANPGDPIDYQIPQTPAPSGGWQTGSLADYFGLPVGVDNIQVSALPFRAMHLIWNEWFRSQDLQPSLTVPKGNGPDLPNTYGGPLRRTKRHDYFTSCLPLPQKGQPIEISLGNEAPVYGKDGLPMKIADMGEASRPTADLYHYAANTLDVGNYSSAWSDNHIANIVSNGTSNVYADLSQASPITINELREAIQLQRLLERDARGGTRYPELIRSHFGVTDPQFDVLQRPQFLGGGSTPITIHSVPQASPTGTYANTPQGNLAAYGTVNVNGHGFTKSFTEHCIIIGLVNVRADLTYQKSIGRDWSKMTRYEFYFPALAHLGEQAILNKEIYAQGTADDNNVFGYNERWAEMRYKPSLITGKLNSHETGGTPLDVWHLSQEFENLPVLGPTFIEENPPIERIIAVTDEPHFIFDAYINMICARPMPVFGVPGYMDHF